MLINYSLLYIILFYIVSVLRRGVVTRDSISISERFTRRENLREGKTSGARWGTERGAPK